MKRIHVVAGGIVQGVCFRYYAQREAETLGVTGWVRNLPDGRIEAVVEGGDADVFKMVKWLRHGPPGAVIDEFQSEEESYSGEFPDFRVRHYWR
jgi:acylphosphatase